MTDVKFVPNVTPINADWLNDVNTTINILPTATGTTKISGTWFGGVVSTVSALASSTGLSLLGFIQSGIGAVARSLQDKLYDSVSIKDFGPLGTSDDTATWSAIINYINANPGCHIRGVAGTYICGVLPNITASDVTLDLFGVVIKSKANSLVSASDSLFVVNGNRVKVRGLTIDGNQSAYSAGVSSVLLAIAGSNHSFSNVTIKNSPGRAVVKYCTFSKFHDCHFDDNAGLGLEYTQGAYNSHTLCTYDRNGYGFQKTRANPADQSHGFAAFGVAIRFRSHHMEFIGCTSHDSGRDGFNVNQGSYAIKFIGCSTLRCDDGGFTIASDNTGSGLPGEGEACYDLEYTDCEAANCYTSGLVAYQPAHNITVTSGRYYNNNRVAGKLAAASSYTNGIYFAAGSTGIVIRTKAYDERQTRVISSIVGGLLTATGWVAGTKDYYPRVAILSGTDMSFKGYGNITSESTGTVTITTSAFNGFSSISAGDYVTQCVQHNAIFLDNSCQATVSVDAWGEKQGPSNAGNKVFSGSFNYSQNVFVDGFAGADMMLNGGFETDLTNWTFNLPGGGTATRNTTTVRSVGSLALVGGSSTAEAVPTLVGGSLKQLSGSFVELGAWCYANKPGDARLLLVYNPGSGYFDSAVDHPGGGWKFLRLGLFVSNNSTDAFVKLTASAGKTVYWDNVNLRTVTIGSNPRDFNPVSRTLPF